MTLRCAIYARYSSDKQSPASIADQIRKCREYAKAGGWLVLERHIYSDEAISGATSERPGLKRLLAAAEAKSFDVVLIDDTSRLSRKTSDAMIFSERLRFYGVRIIFVSQNIDSENEQADVLVSVHGIVDSLYIKELAKKTYRGIEGRALAKQHTGGRIFGYRNVPIENPNQSDSYGRPVISGARLELDEEQAKTVRKIFQMYAGGLSIKGVAKKLNANNVRSPQPREGRQQSWAPSSIRVILRNERYRGIVTWGKTRKVRHPISGSKTKRDRPEGDWVRVEMPEQRIVSEKLWLRVQERLAFVNRVWGSNGRKGGKVNGKYIFSGLLRCGICGANYVLVSGVGYGHKSAEYGCPAHAFRGTCANGRRVKKDTLEAELLAKLQQDVLSDTAVDYCLERLEDEIEKRYTALSGEMETMRRRKAELEVKLKNLSRAIEDGMDSPTLRAAITEREAEISKLTDRTLGTGEGSVRKQMLGLRKFVKGSLGDIRGLLAGKHSNPAIVRQELARHIDAITLLPDGKDSVHYKGQWKVLGEVECAEGQS